MRHFSAMPFLACFFLVGLPAESLAADIVVRVESGTIDTADPGKDFSVWVDNSTGSPVSFATFSLSLTLESPNLNSMAFAIAANQANLYTNPVDYASYVFSGNSSNKDSLDIDPNAYPWVISDGVSTNDVYSVSDITADVSDVVIPDGTSLLLAIVRVLPGTAQAGDQFGLNVVTGGSTSFYKSDTSEVLFSTTNGIINVVPEPSTYLMGCVVTIVSVLSVRRRRSK